MEIHTHTHRCAYPYTQVDALTRGQGPKKSVDPFSVFCIFKGGYFCHNIKTSRYDKHTNTENNDLNGSMHNLNCSADERCALIPLRLPTNLLTSRHELDKDSHFLCELTSEAEPQVRSSSHGNRHAARGTSPCLHREPRSSCPGTDGRSVGKERRSHINVQPGHRRLQVLMPNRSTNL